VSNANPKICAKTALSRKKGRGRHHQLPRLTPVFSPILAQCHIQQMPIFWPIRLPMSQQIRWLRVSQYNVAYLCARRGMICHHAEAKADAVIQSHLGIDLFIDSDANCSQYVFIIFYRSANINTGDIIYQITCRQDPEADAETPIAQANQFLCRVTNEL
jgi:hypothetical protein